MAKIEANYVGMKVRTTKEIKSYSYQGAVIEAGKVGIVRAATNSKAFGWIFSVVFEEGRLPQMCKSSEVEPVI